MIPPRQIAQGVGQGMQLLWALDIASKKNVTRGVCVLEKRPLVRSQGHPGKTKNHRQHESVPPIALGQKLGKEVIDKLTLTFGIGYQRPPFDSDQ